LVIHGLLRRLLLCAVLLVPGMKLHAAEALFVSDIEFVGLQRISEGTVLNYLTLREGQVASREDIRLAVRALFRAGFFDDIAVRVDGERLIFVFEERPTIARFRVTGNKEIQTEQLQTILREQGLAEGRILDPSVLELMEAELERVYHGRGRYNVIVETDVEELENNLVDVTLRIREGAVSRIVDINFVGNEMFDDERLAAVLELRSSHFWSWLTSDDRYSRETLSGDLERLRSFYYDRGYADFEIDSVQVSLSPDRRDVYITIGVREGEVHTVAESRLRGDLIVPAEELEQLILLRDGDTFSMRMAEAGAQLMVRRLEAEGYAFAKVEPIPEVDAESKTVTVTYFVTPGRRAYVRSIVFRDVPGTDDEVYRREMRVFEGAWLNNARLERSKSRLERLPFVETVEVETAPVMGSSDEVDVIFDIKERNAGEFQVGIGYAGSTTGIMGNLSVSHTNFLGTGDTLNFSAVSSSFSRNLSVTHRDPYASIEGISRSVSLFYYDQSSLGRRLEEFDTTSFGAGVDYSYPISEYSFIGWGLSGSSNEITGSRPGSSLVVEEFLTNPDHGDVTISQFGSQEILKLGYEELVVTGRYIYDTRNRAIFANRGVRREISLAVTAPVGDIDYYQARFNQRNFFPLGAGYTLTTNINLGLVEPFGDTTELPPGKRFFAGSFDTIRGFRESYLGPRDVDVYDEDGELSHRGTGYPVGGRLRTFVQAELLLPNFLAEDRYAPPSNTQFALFLDAGNLYEDIDAFDVSEFRVSTGIAATFLTPMGALRFAFGYPLVKEDGDRTERLQFTIGSIF